MDCAGTDYAAEENVSAQKDMEAGGQAAEEQGARGVVIAPLGEFDGRALAAGKIRRIMGIA